MCGTGRECGGACGADKEGVIFWREKSDDIQVIQPVNRYTVPFHSIYSVGYAERSRDAA